MGKLTGWEAGKIGGRLSEKICVAGEKFEDANPGQSFKPSMADITGWVVETVSELGVELAD